MATASLFYLIIIPIVYFAALAGAQLQTEIQALTSFRLSLYDPQGALTGWDSTTPFAPCDWNGVVCFNNQVTSLSLPRLHLTGRLGDSLAGLRQLRKLSLHSNNLNGSVPSSLSQCTLLRAVYLHDNALSGRLPPPLLNLTNLQILDLSRNSLSGSISGEFPASLRYLDLSSNSFSGEIPASSFSSNSELQVVNFSFNKFSGGIPATTGLLKSLQYLWLDSNLLTGTIPSAISNCSELVHFSADDNSLRGLIPATLGGAALPKLQVVSLARNSVSGFVPTALLCNGGDSSSSSLRIVDLGFNALTGIIEPQNARCWSILEVLILQSNNINGAFPSWLTNVTSLRVIGLSDNIFSGELPAGIGNLFRLEELKVANNTLTGEIPGEIAKCTSLRALDLGGNRFSGQFPGFLGGMRSLRLLSLGGNMISGTIPTSLGTLSGLESLNLSGNNLTGEVPVGIMQLRNLTSLNLSNNKFSGDVLGNVASSLRSLKALNLSNCGLSGSVPVSIGSLMRLNTLDLSKQELSGELPSEIFGLPNLQVVALQENQLSGDVPQGFSSLTSLLYLNLSSNGFSGVIPVTYGYLRSLTVLSLSENRISGVIPPELGDSLSLHVLELGSNQLGDKIPSEISKLSNLEELDLGHNRLTGEIPEVISKCSALTALLLDGNQLSGPIPKSLALLSNLVALDLSSNKLSGEIPANISLIPHLTYLNLSNNELSGEIPEPLGSRFNGSVFAMNPSLCGKPLDRECGDEKRRRRNRLILYIGVAAGGSLLLLLCCCGYVYSLFRWRKKLREMVVGEKKRPSPGRASSGERSGRGSGDSGGGGPKLVMFNNKITYAEALEATRQFDEENVLSRGKYGLVFKASFQDGMVLSIRRLPASSLGVLDEEAFHKEAEALGKVKHRNLTVLRGYYAGPDVRLLVYDYMPNGNLATLLQEASHQDGHVLNWPMRHLIALGIAKGIAFLHSVSMVHGDVKPQNVLFDADFEAHLSEFGLDRLTIVSPKASSSSQTIGTLGYVSPEAQSTGQATREADVYSFGIVLLEILTGRKPVMFTEEEDIVKWVKKQLQRGQVTELLEPGLLELDPESSESEEFLLGVKVGLLCTAPDPIDRPSMAEIVFMLEGCRVGPDIPSSADPTSLPSPS